MRCRTFKLSQGLYSSIALAVCALILAIPHSAYAAPSFQEYLDACRKATGGASCRSEQYYNRTLDDAGRQALFDSLDLKTVEKNRENLKNPPPTTVNCSATTDYLFHLPTCLIRAGFSWIGAALIWIGVTIATAAGGIFEWSIQYTIVKFAEYLQIIRPAIDAGWTGLRDIANIVIIGLFVFVAINIILGVKEFGEKKAVAKILIIAVLINFSMLFTKIIVDASNFTAYQFYNSMVKGVDSGANQTVGKGGIGDFQFSVTSSGISASFMKFLGVEGIFDTQDKLKKITDNNQNALYALGYGLLSLVFLLAVAAVFLYGAFLIISRAVLIVFLMLTSALAFATWIIPHQFISDGWEKWWKSLLKSAFLAPILMAFLWMTLRVSQELSNALVTRGPGAGGTLGKLADNASDPQNLVALLNFALILGLLYASIVTSNAFSKTISGFRFAQAGVGGALLTAPSLAWRFTGAPLMRQTAGRFGFWKEKGAISEAKASRSEAGQLRMEARQLSLTDKKAADAKIREAEGLVRQAARSERTASRYGTLARAGYNVGDVGLVKKLGKTLTAPGLSGAERGRDVARGFAQAAEQRIAEGEKRAQKLAVSAGERDKIYQDKYAEVRASRTAGEKSRAADVEREKVAYERAAATPRADRDRAQEALNRLVGENVRIEDARHFAASHRDPAIQRAAQELVGHQYNLDTVRTRLDEAEKELVEFHGKVEAEARGAAKTAVDAAEEGAAEAARAVGRKAAGILTTPDLRKHIGDEVRGKFRSGLATKSLRDVLAMQMKELESGAAPSRPAPAPAPGVAPTPGAPGGP